MSPRFQSQPSLVAPIILSVLGVSYCLFVYLGVGESVCVTAGCSLYRSFAVFGISLWIFGIVAFVALTLFMAAGMYSLSRWFAGLCVAADCVLLLVMAATSPCLSCLGVAFLFALTYFLLRHADTRKPESCSGLLFVWSLFFAVNLALSAREMLPPEPIYGTSQAPVHIYFSPTCDSCLSAMEEFRFGDEQVAYFATARNDTDLRMLIALKERLDRGGKMPEALKAVKDSPNLPEYSLSRDNLMLQWQLLRNKARVIERSGGTVPYITINGAPVNGPRSGVLPGENLQDAGQESGSAVASQSESGQAGGPGSEPAGSEVGLMRSDRGAGTDPMPGNNAVMGADVRGGSAGLIFNNATMFETCSDESGQDCGQATPGTPGELP